MFMIKRMLMLAKPWWWALILTVISLFLSSALSLVTPEAVRQLTEHLQVPDSLSTKVIITYVVVMLAAYLLRGIFRFFSLWLAHVGAWNFVANLTHICYEKLQSLSMRFYSDKQTGEIMSRMINDTRQLELLIAHSLPDIVSNILIIIGVSIMIFVINPYLALFTLIPVPFILILSRIFITKVAPLFKINQENLAGLNALTLNNLSGMKEIQAFNKEDYELERMKEYCRSYSYVNIRANFFSALYHPTAEFMTSIGTVIVMGVGGVLVMHGTMSTADIVGYFMYLSMFYTPLSTLARLIEDIQVSGACANRICELLDTESEIMEDLNAEEIPKSSGEIEFQNVSFAYSEEKNVLDNISFKANPGEMVALVGATGVGKTTIVSLIERFYDPTDGKILINGHDIKHSTLRSLRDNISIVLQDIYLFNGTIYDNIAYGVENAEAEQVYEAARIACADDFIRAMPDGYNTVIGERGVKLSGGQKQRITIARAILRQTPILILDEATSAIDNETEAEIQKAIENLAGRMTIIVIAHRLTTVMKADKILVLKEGRIVESGSHSDLIEKDGVYASMCKVNQVKIGE
ncbi:MAG: ABC transporter ATP-binding protein [Ruminococcaceae bacterium]|nr:ABC transporter ATP-binding protein [Oscillospiraceae bacterium]